VVEMDRIFQVQDPDGTPAAFLDGQPLDPSVLYDQGGLGTLLRA
jgi:hypothetical protein